LERKKKLKLFISSFKLILGNILVLYLFIFRFHPLSYNQVTILTFIFFFSRFNHLCYKMSIVLSFLWGFSMKFELLCLYDEDLSLYMSLMNFL